MKSLEEENARLKRLVAELSLGKNGDEWCNKKLLKPGLIKTIVNYVLEKFGLSVRKACKILGTNRTTFLYKKNDTEILAKMKEIIKKRPKASCNMITMLLHKDGIKINHKRVERLYKENKMQLRIEKKEQKKYSVNKKDEHILTEKLGKWLAVDFVIDSIANKRQLKNLTVIDPVSKVAQRIIPAYSMQGEVVAEILNENYFESYQRQHK